VRKFIISLLDSLKSLGYQINFCPVCGKKNVKFMPLPAYYRENALKYGYRYFGEGETISLDRYSCAACGASDRERLYALYLSRKCRDKFGAKLKMLHIAPEQALSACIRRWGVFDYHTADQAMEGVDDHIDITCMSLYQDAAYDCFICSHVLEHVADDAAAIAELFRVLKPGGWGILMAPVITHLDTTIEDPTVTDEAGRWRLFGQGDHVRLYAKNDFIKRIGVPGFVVEQFGVFFFGAKTFDMAGITRQSVLYVVRRPE
jgi:SAM-dependent methyltransferase